MTYKKRTITSNLSIFVEHNTSFKGKYAVMTQARMGMKYKKELQKNTEKSETLMMSQSHDVIR